MNNPLAFVQAMRNPQQFLQQAMQNNHIMSNPMAKNALEMMQSGNNKGLEEMARNLCKEKNINPEDAMKMAKSYLGM